MKGVLWGGGFLLLLAFQGSSYNPLEIWGIKPDLLLLGIYCLGLLRGEVWGGLSGAGLGLLMDLFSAGPFYQNLVVLGIIGVFAGLLGHWLRHAGAFLHAWILFGVSLIQGTVIAVILSLIFDSSFWGDLLHIVLPQAVYDGVLGSLILNFLSVRWERQRKVRWAGPL
jgi:rod shape-determining protein MreD